MGWMRWRVETAMLAMIAMEVLEARLREAGPEGAGLWEHESAGNITMDIVAGYAGWWIGKNA